MKYIIDLDAFIECLDFLHFGTMNGVSVTPIDNVKALMQRFPKTPVSEEISIQMESKLTIKE